MPHPLTTTLNAILACSPCKHGFGWRKLLQYLGKTKADDEALPFETILDSNGLDDALWCCQTAPQYAREWRLLAVSFARDVIHLVPDPRLLESIEIIERFVYDNASKEELEAAQNTILAVSREVSEPFAFAVTWSIGCAARGSLQAVPQAAIEAAEAIILATTKTNTKADANTVYEEVQVKQAEQARVVFRGEKL